MEYAWIAHLFGPFVPCGMPRHWTRTSAALVAPDARPPYDISDRGGGEAFWLEPKKSVGQGRNMPREMSRRSDPVGVWFSYYPPTRDRLAVADRAPACSGHVGLAASGSAFHVGMSATSDSRVIQTDEPVSFPERSKSFASLPADFPDSELQLEAPVGQLRAPKAPGPAPPPKAPGRAPPPKAPGLAPPPKAPGRAPPPRRRQPKLVTRPLAKWPPPSPAQTVPAEVQPVGSTGHQGPDREEMLVVMGCVAGLEEDVLAGNATAVGRIPQGEAPFGRKLHWIDPSYAAAGRSTVFDLDDRSEGLGSEFDPRLLTAVLGGQAAPLRRERLPSDPGKQTGIRVFDTVRAQHIAIMLSRLPVPVEEVCTSLQAVDCADVGLPAEGVELLLGKLPTRRESQQLLAHAGHAEELRDVERKMLPLCNLPDLEGRLRVIHVNLTHTDRFSALRGRFECMHEAAKEVLASARLHDLLRLVLKVANYINYGLPEGAVAIPVRSLPAFASFRIGSVSALHYLGLTLCSESFLRGLASDLAHLREAARQNTPALKQELSDFQELIGSVEGQLSLNAAATGGGTGGTASADVADPLCDEVGTGGSLALTVAETSSRFLLRELRKEYAALQLSADRAWGTGAEAQRFLGDSASRLAPNEEFFGHISAFINSISAVVRDIGRNPRRWERVVTSEIPTFADAGGA